MPVASYVRPLTLADALDALARPGAIVIGGGTRATRTLSPGPVTIVDLQALGFDRSEEAPDGTLILGATVTLRQLADDPAVPAAIRECARREAPSTLRSLSTVAGCVAVGDPESELLAALLVHDARVVLAGRDSARTVDLSVLLGDRQPLAGRIITAVAIRTGGVAAVARTGRTAADRAIVAAVARRTPTGALRLAVTGIGVAPLLIDPARDVTGALDRLSPPGDFRGSSGYRRMLAGVLTRRALEEVGA